MSKTCSSCKETKPLNNKYFIKNEMYKDGFLGRCRECVRKYQREYRKTYDKKIKEKKKKEKEKYDGNWNKTLEEALRDTQRIIKGVENKELDIKLIKGHKYHVPKIIRAKSMGGTQSFTGRLEQETKDLIVLRHKKNYCECFRKADFLTGELELRKL